jgi:hypothetical protein
VLQLVSDAHRNTNNLEQTTYPAHTPAQLISFLRQMIVAELLNVEIVDLERCMGNVRLVARLYHLEEECVVIGVLGVTVDVEEARDRFVTTEHDIARDERNGLCVYHSNISSYLPSG